jgi:hypothetical protein
MLACVCAVLSACSTEPPVFPVEGFKAERYTIATTAAAELSQKLIMIPVSTTAIATSVTSSSMYCYAC